MRIFFVLLLLFAAISCIKPIDEKNLTELNGDYLGQIPPGDSALVFAEWIVSTQFDVRDAAFSPDGNEFFYSIRGAGFHSILNIKRKDGVWNSRNVASFSGKYSDIEPCFSHDGNKLYFVSNRPIDEIGEPKDYDIWYVEKKNNAWSNPKNLGLPINTEADEFYPSFTKEGDIYYCANYENGKGGEDLYFSKFTEGSFQNPVNLGDSVNSVRDEFNSFVSPDGDYIIFTSMGWGPGRGGGDLWISFKNENNEWKKPRNLGESVNSAFFEYCPNLSPDGKYFFFTSNRSGIEKYSSIKMNYKQIIEGLNTAINGSQNIYWIKSDFIHDLNRR